MEVARIMAGELFKGRTIEEPSASEGGVPSGR